MLASCDGRVVVVDGALVDRRALCGCGGWSIRLVAPITKSSDAGREGGEPGWHSGWLEQWWLGAGLVAGAPATRLAAWKPASAVVSSHLRALSACRK